MGAVAPVGRAAGGFDETHRFVFYAVLEGCYEDGLSNSDVDQILLKSEKQTYLHFIYACPLCMPAIQAFEAYRSRPARFFGDKRGTSTFGEGLEPALMLKLHNTKVEDRLEAINALVQRWIQRRTTQLRLTQPERTTLHKELEAKRQKGMEMLQAFKKNDTVAMFAPSFADKAECAVCNGAVGMDFRPRAK